MFQLHTGTSRGGRGFARLLCAAAGLALLTGCSQAGPTSPTDRSDSEQPRPGGTLRLRVQGDPHDWDMTFNGRADPNNWGVKMAHDTVMGFKAGPDVPFEALELEPRLAERWQVSPDAKVFTFQLRQGVKFANLPPVNGRELTSADVKFSYEYEARAGEFAGKKELPASFIAGQFYGLESIDTPDQYTVVVKLKDSFVPFLNYIASDRAPIMPKEIYEQDGNFQKQIVGSGPFQLDSAASQPGSRWVWRKNPNYWKQGRPYLDQVNWLVLPDDPAAIVALKANQADGYASLFGYVTTSQAEDIRANAPAINLNPHVPVGPLHLYMNVTKPPLDDVRVRRAVSYAMDRDEFIKVFAPGEGKWALAGAFLDTFTQDEMKQMVPHDPEHARQLLAEAGYRSGLDLPHEFPGNFYGDRYIQQVQLFQAQLKKVGINLVLQSIDAATHSANRRASNFVISLLDKSVESDIDSYVFDTFHSSSSRNYGKVKDQKLDDMLAAQRREADPAKRKEVIRQAVSYINREMAHNLAVYYGVDYQFMRSTLKGWAPNFGNNGVLLIDAWLAQ